MIKKETSFIDLKQVKIDDPFFSRVQNVVIHTMLPYQERVLHDEVSGIRKSHVIKNFRIAAGDEKGTYYGRVFQDSDLAKWLEAVAYSLKMCIRDSHSSRSAKQALDSAPSGTRTLDK